MWPRSPRNGASPTTRSSRETRWSKAALVSMGCILGLALGLSVGRSRASGPHGSKSPYQKLAVFARVLSYVEHEYVVPVNRDRVIEDAIRGMLRGLDPHTQFFSAAQVKRLQTSLTGRYSGVGLSFSRRRGLVVVLSATPGGPASRAGVSAGDILLAIDGKPVRGMDLPTISARLRGRRLTRLKLTFKSAAAGGAVRTISLLRDTIRAAHVLKAPLCDGLGLVRVSRFSQGVTHSVLSAIKTLRAAYHGHLAGLVLDLRNNPGGLMDEGVRLADQFLSRGLIVRKVGKRGRLRESEMAHSRSTIAALPLAVLINRGTASASEIVAGALKDHRRAQLVGERSYGKGSMQSIIPLPDGSRLKLTIAYYYRPSGKAISGMGVKPNVSVKRGRHAPKPPPAGVLSGPSRPVSSCTNSPSWARKDPALWAATKLLKRRARHRARAR